MRNRMPWLARLGTAAVLLVMACGGDSNDGSGGGGTTALGSGGQGAGAIVASTREPDEVIDLGPICVRDLVVASGEIYLAGTSDKGQFNITDGTIPMYRYTLAEHGGWSAGPPTDETQDASSEGVALAVTSAGELRVAGSWTDSVANQPQRTLLQAYDAAGQLLWGDWQFAQPSGYQQGAAVDVALTSADEPLVAIQGGELRIYASDGSSFTSLPAPDHGAVGMAVSRGSNDDIVLAGLAVNPDGGQLAFTRKLSPTGTLLWEKVDAEVSPTTRVFWNINGVAITADDEVVVAGMRRTSPAESAPEVFVRKRAADGSELWTSWFTFGDNTNDFVSSVAVDSSGGCLVTAQLDNASGLAFYLNADGVLQWSSSHAHTGAATSRNTAGAFDGDGNALVAGCSVAGAYLLTFR